MHLDLTLTLETPFLPGSADPNKVDLDWPLRPSEVKGIWRWWARALVAGALFDMGLLHGVSKQDVVKVPTRNEAMCISKIVGKELGLGYAGSDGSQASCFKILIEPYSESLNTTTRGYRNLNRINLLYLGSRKGKEVPQIIQTSPTVSLTMTVENRKGCYLPSDRIEASMTALALAMKLQCFGKGGRRGLGCFRVRARGDYAYLFDKSPEELITQSTKVINKIVKEGHQQHCGNLQGRRLSQCELPPMPTLSINASINNYVNCIDKELLKSNRVNRLTPYMLIKVEGRNLLDILHNFFLRSTRVFTLKGNVYVNDDLRDKFKAWVLGLPRMMKEKEKKEEVKKEEMKEEKEKEKKKEGTGYSGYLMPGSVSRRASPMLVAVHGNEAYVSVFTSADWPSTLTWSNGADEQPITIDEREIVNAMSIAINEFLEYLDKNNVRWSVWP